MVKIGLLIFKLNGHSFISLVFAPDKGTNQYCHYTFDFSGNKENGIYSRYSLYYHHGSFNFLCILCESLYEIIAEAVLLNNPPEYRLSILLAQVDYGCTS